jgi:hypothetical protein
MVLFSNGIPSQFVRRGGFSALAPTHPQDLAEQIAGRFGRQDDDIAVLVLAITGSQAGM